MEVLCFTELSALQVHRAIMKWKAKSGPAFAGSGG
jgi:hypothetical protein